MNRGEIRFLLRSLIDQPTEAPLGSFLNTELDIYINLGKVQVKLDLARLVPGRFKKWKKLSMTAAKGEYSLATDFTLTDVLIISNILRNKTGERPIPLFRITDDNKWLLTTVGETGDPIGWDRGEEGSILFRPIPNATYADRYLMVYIEDDPALNHDTSDTSPSIATPHLPTLTHPLIAYKAAEFCKIKDEELGQDIETKYTALLKGVADILSATEGVPLGGLTPSPAEILGVLQEI